MEATEIIIAIAATIIALPYIVKYVFIGLMWLWGVDWR